MVDRDALAARLDVLLGYVSELEAFAAIDTAQFATEPATHHLAERYVHLACECVLDIAHHVIADLGLEQPLSYRGAAEVLCKADLLERGLSERIARWLGLRNLLVHAYLEIDHRRVHQAIRDDLSDLRDFARAMAPLLGD